MICYMINEQLTRYHLEEVKNGHNPYVIILTRSEWMPDRYGELEKSSEALFQIATDEKFSNISGKYFDRSTNIKESSALSYVKENRNELWEKSLKYCGL